MAQETKKETKEKPKNYKVFGNIYTGFYYTFNDNYTPRSAFEFSTGLLGYRHKISEKITATLIYDVTRTTNNIKVSDSIGNSFNVTYFEGSKYTAFLKMGEIDWNITDYLQLSVGQLLNQQYLTVQDKWWGYRYIAVSYQEKYRYGMPADFGSRLTYKGNLLKYSITVTNGEGPFRHQDDGSKFLVASNIDITPVDGLMIKMYNDYEPAPSSGVGIADKNVNSFFVGYKKNKIMAGLEYNEIRNYGYMQNENVYGISLYGSYKITDKFDVLARADYGNLYPQYDNNAKLIDNKQYYIAGLQYQPEKNLFTSVNFRYTNPEDIPQVYANFGIKF
ncbi:MAG: hypothetical protein C0594_15850 [Marinilabiliales bacterium]|nr:MAG: hypothetical protein C0594_15850 [Marinilabiliales bacterium]